MRWQRADADPGSGAGARGGPGRGRRGGALREPRGDTHLAGGALSPGRGLGSWPQMQVRESAVYRTTGQSGVRRTPSGDTEKEPPVVKGAEGA